MKRKKLQIIYVIAFCLLISLPLIQMNAKVFPVKPLQEKRTKASMPDFAFRLNVTNFCEGFENYIKDNFGFRESLIRLSNNIDLRIFKKSPNKSVVLGKDDYLFIDEEIRDFDRTSTLSDEDIDIIANNIANFQKELKKRGVDFLFSVAPNKSTIYPEFVGRESKNPNLESNEMKLIKALDKRNVKYLNFKDIMLKNKEKYNLYYKRDTHWNNIACALAADAMLKKLGPQFGVEGSIDIARTYPYKHLGDLDVLLGVNTEITEYTADLDIKQSNTKMPKGIFYHDSFSNGVMPLLDSFTTQKIALHNINTPIHSTYPVYYRNAKVVYFEMVERYIPQLLHYSFDVFDNETTDLDEKYKPVTLNLDKDKNPNLKLKNSISENVTDEGYTYFATTEKNGYITFDIDKKDIDYLYLELEYIDNYTKMQISWAKEDKEFNDKDRISLELSPMKKKYVIPIKAKDISKLKINIDTKANKELNIKKLKLY